MSVTLSPLSTVSLSARSRRLGSIFLCFVGVAHILVSSVILAVSVDGSLLDRAIQTLPVLIDDVTVLRAGSLLGYLAFEIALLVSLLFLGVGIVQILYSWYAYRGHHRRGTIIATALGVPAVLMTPVALIALFLFFGSRDTFETVHE